MAYTKEQRIINQVTGTKKTQKKQVNNPVSNSFEIPNKSGDHYRSIKRDAPVNDYDLVNKSYVDNIVWDISDNTNLAVTSPIVLTDDTLSFSFATTNTWTAGNTFQSDFYIASNIVHEGDPDTYIAFTNDKIASIAGGTEAFSVSPTLVVSNEDLSIVKEIKGTRVQFQAGFGAEGGSSRYLKTTNGADFSATHGFVMPHAGSIVSVAASTVISGYSLSGTSSFQVRVNDSLAYQTQITPAGNGHIDNYATQARNTDTFSAGDLIQVYYDHKGTYNINDTVVTFEVVYDD